MRLIATSWIAAVVLVAVLPATASAGVAFRIGGGDSMAFESFKGEANDVTITRSPDGTTYTIHDDGADLAPGTDCTTVDARTVTCPARPTDTFFVDLTDRNDTAVVDAPVTSICGGLGNDHLIGGSGRNLLAGEEGDDTLDGGPDLDFLEGSEDCDLEDYDDEDGNDTMNGNGGQDTFEAGSGDDTLRGGAGDDRLFSFDGSDSLEGGPGGDLMVGYGGADSLTGGGDGDFLQGGSGNDTLDGGDGDDELGPTTRISGETVAEAGDDTFDGGAGDDVLFGGPGERFPHFSTPVAADVPDAALNGADTLRGGSGRDTVSFVNRSSAVGVTLDGLRNDGAAGENDLVAPDVEMAVGGAGDDTLAGGTADDTLDGASGRDVIDGGDGADRLLGGTSDEATDRITGGPGPDFIDGGPGDDSLGGGDDDDDVDGGGGQDALAGDSGNDGLEGGGGIDALHGGDGDDTLDGAATALVGADGGDDIHGDAGRDRLIGQFGDDTLDGGTGPDVLEGGDGSDTADYASAAAPVRVSFDGRPNDGAAAEGDLVGADVDGARGGRHADTLVGSERAEKLEGGGGDDYVDGGGGPDELNGGRGADVVRAIDDDGDRLNCGRSRDLAIVGDDDRARACEDEVAPGDRARRNRSVLVRPSGPVEIAIRDANRTVPLVDPVALPMGTSIVARRRAVRLGSAAGRPARARGAFFLAAGPRGFVDLVSDETRSCARPGGIDITARSGFRTRGLNAVASGSGSWRSEERCRGTFVRSQSGLVTVDDGARVLRLGPRTSYLAR